MARTSGLRRAVAPGRTEPAKPSQTSGSEFPEADHLDRLIHERLRLGIVSALAANAALTFTDLKRLLKTTDGNLSVHAGSSKRPATCYARRPSKDERPGLSSAHPGRQNRPEPLSGSHGSRDSGRAEAGQSSRIGKSIPALIRESFPTAPSFRHVYIASCTDAELVAASPRAATGRRSTPSSSATSTWCSGPRLRLRRTARRPKTPRRRRFIRAFRRIGDVSRRFEPEDVAAGHRVARGHLQAALDHLEACVAWSRRRDDAPFDPPSGRGARKRAPMHA